MRKWIRSHWILGIALGWVAMGSVVHPEAACASTGRRVSLAPVPDHPPLPEESLSRQRLLAQIDSLEILYREAEGRPRAQLATAMARRFLAMHLIKHRRRALELLEEASRVLPSYFPARHLQAATAAAMHYDGQARRWYEALCRDFPREGKACRLLGDFRFLAARRTLDEPGFEAAAAAYRNAVAADSTDAESKLRLAGSLIALGRFDGALPLLDSAARDSIWARSALLLRGCVHTAREEEQSAWKDFHQAFATADSSLREVFLYGSSFFQESRAIEDRAARLDPAVLATALHRVDPEWREEDGLKVRKALRDSTVLRKAVQSYWRSRNPWPTHLSNRDELRYWRRLVEAELLFGRPEEDLRGWDRAPGRAWVVWGRPRATLYLAASGGSRIDDLEAFSFEPGTLLPPSSVGIWAWDYRSSQGHFSLLFEDTVMNGNWLAHDSTARLLRLAQKRQPVLLLPSQEHPPAFRLELSTAAFHRPAGATTLESYLLVRRNQGRVPIGVGGGNTVEEEGEKETDPGAAAAPLELWEAPRRGGEFSPASQEFQLEWAVFDDGQHRLEYETMPLGKESRLDVLRREMGLMVQAGDTNAWLAVIPADLRPGRYRVAVDVRARETGDHLSRQSRLVVPRREGERLSLSDLELASSFQALKGDERLPSSLVKYAFGILPVPGGIFPSGARQLHVYYEVYNLGRGRDGVTHFDVSYRVYRRKDKDHRWILSRRDVAGLSPVDPLGLRYLRESTDLSQQQHVVKGGTVEIAGLAPGRYVLEVLVRDRVRGSTARSWVPFAKAATPETGNPGRTQEPQ